MKNRTALQILILCLIISFCFGFLNLFYFFQLGDNYFPCWGDENGTLIAGLSVYKSNFLPNDNQVYEHAGKKDFALLGVYVPLAIFSLFFSFLNNVTTFILLKNLILPPLYFLFLYYLLRYFKLPKLRSMVIALAILLFPNAIFYPGSSPGSIAALINTLKSRIFNYYFFYRFYSPQMTYFFSTAAFFTTYLLLKKNSKFILTIHGVLLGLLCYTYLYSWTVIWMANFSILCFLIFKQNPVAKKFIISISIGFLIGLYYFINIIFLTST